MSVEPRFADLYTQGWGPLVGLLISVGGSRSDAEEVAQDAYEKLLRAWPRVCDYDDAQGWVRSVAVRDLVSRHRRARVAWRKHAVVAEPEWLNGTVDDAARRLDVRAAMSMLSVDHRAVVLLHHVEDLGVKEVADVLGVSVGTVKSRLSRARSHLTQHLDHLLKEQS